jgi:hypothetical protein
MRMGNVRHPYPHIANAVADAFMWNGWLPMYRIAAASEYETCTCERCHRPFRARKHWGSASRPKYCLGCARYHVPKRSANNRKETDAGH